MLDLVYWFFVHHKIIDHESDSDTHKVDSLKHFVIPLTVCLGQQIICYKKMATRAGYRGAGTPEEVAHQIESAIFYIPGMKIAYNAEILHEHINGCYSDSDDSQPAPSELFDLSVTNMFRVKEREPPDSRPPDGRRSHVDDFLAQGQNNANKQIFKGLSALSCQFDLGNVWNLPLLNETR